MITAENIYEFLTLIFTFISALGAMWYILSREISRLREELLKYKTYVAETFVSNAHLNEVEERIIKSVETLSNDFKEFRKDFTSRKGS